MKNKKKKRNGKMKNQNTWKRKKTNKTAPKKIIYLSSPFYCFYYIYKSQCFNIFCKIFNFYKKFDVKNFKIRSKNSFAFYLTAQVRA